MKLSNANISGRIYTGCLVGFHEGVVYNCQVTDANVAGESETGLLVGRTNGIVKKCSVSGTVTGTGNDSTGRSGWRKPEGNG